MFANRFVNKNNNDFLNIAIIANPSMGLDALCASIGLKELIKLSLKDKKQDISIDIYYLATLPFGAEILRDKAKVKNKLGEKSLEIEFPAESLEKVLYDYNQEKKSFKISLVGFKGKKPLKKEISFKEVKEEFDLMIGLGFKDIKEFERYHTEIKSTSKKEVFNKENLKSKSLTEGIMDLFYSEKIKPSKTASVAFFTYLSSPSVK
ncbi:MAG TPA: hypothetical protein ENJ78_00245 [candidate division WWE3 bacterium]|uniref:Uncharacterized protein n=1 Tax=candidate division WWE3 bacterium TaxID=2053526 RepID=A0A7V5MHX6_UNCKA|nr:hypothetical protein [candidate division WWE3 bacterium]